MRERLERRLEDLRGELAMGEKQLAELDAQREQLKNTLLRISGAIQVLEEELGGGEDGGAEDEPAAGSPDGG